MLRALLLFLTLAVASVAGAADVLVSLPFPVAGRPGSLVNYSAQDHNRVPDVPVSAHLEVT